MGDYATAAMVKSFLQLPEAFSGSTNPTDVEVETFIVRNEGIIDKKTGHSWREKTFTEEFHLQPPHYSRRDGNTIFLNHRKVKTMDSGQGDVLTVWNGSTDEDYLANRVESRNNDFWFDYDMGILHIRTLQWTSPRFFSVNITYRHGEASVDPDIQKACILLTCADITGSDDRSALFPEGNQGNVPLSSKAQMWREEAAGIIQDNREFKSGVM